MYFFELDIPKPNLLARGRRVAMLPAIIPSPGSGTDHIATLLSRQLVRAQGLLKAMDLHRLVEEVNRYRKSFYERDACDQSNTGTEWVSSSL